MALPYLVLTSIPQAHVTPRMREGEEGRDKGRGWRPPLEVA